MQPVAQSQSIMNPTGTGGGWGCGSASSVWIAHQGRSGHEKGKKGYDFSTSRGGTLIHMFGT